MGKWCLQASAFIFDRIIINAAGNQVQFRASGFHGPFICCFIFLPQMSDCCPLGLLVWSREGGNSKQMYFQILISDLSISFQFLIDNIKFYHLKEIRER